MNSTEQEITAELDAQDLAPAQAAQLAPRERPDVVLPVTFAAKTDLGRVRENNEDKFDWWEPEDPAMLANRGRLYAVADGMGGHAAGQIASEMALKAMAAAYFSNTRGTPDEALSRAIIQANATVFDTARAIPSRSGMGCTVVTIALVDTTAVVAWAGDSRCYLVRAGAARRVTEDHSWVAEQVRAGVLTEETAERSPYRNIITRCLGPEPNVTPDVLREELSPGDILLMCSDGLTGVVPDAEIGEIAASRPPSFACRELIELANERGGPDNITVAILRVDGAGAPAAPVEHAAVTAVPVPEPDEESQPRKRRGLFRR